MATAPNHSVEFYVIFEAQVYNGRVMKLRATRMTKAKPALSGGEIAFKFKTNVPDAAFLRLIPDVDVTIPEGFWTSQPVEVLVADPNDEKETADA